MSLMLLLTIPFATGDLIEAMNSKEWPSTTATITSSNIYYFQRGGTITIKYRYWVNGKPYDGEFEEKETRQSGLEHVRSRWVSYKQNATMTVYFNPKHPERTLQEFKRVVGAKLGILLFMSFGALLLGAVGISNLLGYCGIDWPKRRTNMKKARQLARRKRVNVIQK